MLTYGPSDKGQSSADAMQASGGVGPHAKGGRAGGGRGGGSTADGLRGGEVGLNLKASVMNEGWEVEEAELQQSLQQREELLSPGRWGKTAGQAGQAGQPSRTDAKEAGTLVQRRDYIEEPL
jgi:hypothetical protein